nr:methylenetetrahydrofolate reductase 1 [Tanacetum cinerariifolium]
TREGAFISLESIYETVKDDSLTDPEVYYYKSGMVRRTGGYDYYNPCGWDRLDVSLAHRSHRSVYDVLLGDEHH